MLDKYIIGYCSDFVIYGLLLFIFKKVKIFIYLNISIKEAITSDLPTVVEREPIKNERTVDE